MGGDCHSASGMFTPVRFSACVFSDEECVLFEEVDMSKRCVESMVEKKYGSKEDVG